MKIKYLLTIAAILLMYPTISNAVPTCPASLTSAEFKTAFGHNYQRGDIVAIQGLNLTYIYQRGALANVPNNINSIPVDQNGDYCTYSYHDPITNTVVSIQFVGDYGH